MNRSISLCEFKRFIMNVLESEKYITLNKDGSAHSPTFSFSVPVSSCSTTRKGLQFHVYTGYINLDFDEFLSEDSLIHFYLRESNDKPNEYRLDLGEVSLFFHKSAISQLLKEIDGKNSKNGDKHMIRGREKELEHAIIEGRKL